MTWTRDRRALGLLTITGLMTGEHGVGIVWALSARKPGRLTQMPDIKHSSQPFTIDRADSIDGCSPELLMGQAQKSFNEVIPGTLDMLVLKTVSRQTMHGYAVAQTIQRLSQDVLRIEEGALYPALHRLEVRGLLRSEWGVSNNNRRAKFYSLTTAGRRALEQEATSWSRVAVAINRVMQSA